jgi:FtsZ-binding cell division protein ZapB
MSKAVEKVRQWRKRQRGEGKRSLTLWLEGETVEQLQAQARELGVTMPDLIARLAELLQGDTGLKDLVGRNYHEQKARERAALKAEVACLQERIQALLDRYKPSHEPKSVAES